VAGKTKDAERKLEISKVAGQIGWQIYRRMSMKGECAPLLMKLSLGDKRN
jgi:hypothetical protein